VLLQLGDGGEKGLLREIFGDRDGASAAVEEIAVDARQRVVVEPVKRVRIEGHRLVGGRPEDIRERDREHRSWAVCRKPTADSVGAWVNSASTHHPSAAGRRQHAPTNLHSTDGNRDALTTKYS
jgi:hypothetical protein